MIVQMRTLCTCFSVLQGPKGGLFCYLKGNPVRPPISGTWSETFHSLNRSYQGSGSFKPVGSNSYRSSSANQIGSERNKRSITTGVEPSICEGIKDHDGQEKIECGESQRLVPIIVFDIETTGFSRKTDRLIEIAFRDLRGGDNSTFVSLVNPGRYVGNDDIHGITTAMANRPENPRFKELIPTILHYIKSRQIPSLPVLLVAHNAYSFDVPFLKYEFGLCSEEIPSDWLFLDTLPLAKELKKLDGPKQQTLTKFNLLAMREYYEIPLEDLYLDFEEHDEDDEPLEEFPCPFCSDDFDIIGLCCHIDDEHPVEAKNGVCPVCGMRVGIDMVGHIASQHGQFFKISLHLKFLC
ncbi:hypothetical protein GIB67_035126 [Kingdonia uniflora]|uniref:Exonuclease domain-containing protein n=1 Tax=Kingdonia uniflora TaxID=39325 RepID=A0A7J7NVI1_9MAGN|nr:hypothetical protein GIB67_035126 [Kingdonia uniflora]